MFLSDTIFLHPPYGAAVIFPLGLFCFTVCIPNTLAFRQKIEESSPFLRVPLFNLLFPTCFRRLFRSCRQIFSYWQFLCKLQRFSIRLIFSEVSAFVVGLIFYSALIWRVSSGYFFSQKVPCSLGDPKF